MSDARHRAIIMKSLLPKAKADIIINLSKPINKVFNQDDLNLLSNIQKRGVDILFIVNKKYNNLDFPQMIVDNQYPNPFVTIDEKRYWFQKKDSEEGIANFNDKEISGKLKEVALS